MHRILLLLALLLLLPGATAQINGPLPFDNSYGFATDLSDVPIIVSAKMDYVATNAQEGSVFLDVQEFSVQGLEQVCWDAGPANQCIQGNDLSVVVATGSSLAFRMPTGFRHDIQSTAAHALVFFVDAAALVDEEHDEDLGFGRSLLQVPFNGETHIQSIDPLPVTNATGFVRYNDARNEMALLLSFSESSRMTVMNGDTVQASLVGDGQWVGLQGRPVMDKVVSDVSILPVPNGGSADFTPASTAIAQAALRPEQLDHAMSAFEETEAEAADLGQVQQIIGPLAAAMNGALVGVDTGKDLNGTAEVLSASTFVRFTELTTTRDGNEVQMQGEAALQIQQGEVVGAKPLIGIFPWWGLLLWSAALGLFIVRTAKRADRKHPRWDRFRWVGFIGGALSSLLLFWLWDMETAALWGTSVLSGSSEGLGLGAVAFVQLLPLFLAGFVVGLPTRSLGKSIPRIAGQGHFMGIGAILAPMVTYVLGAPLMLDFLAALIEALGG